jgi:hypothetical protein
VLDKRPLEDGGRFLERAHCRERAVRFRVAREKRAWTTRTIAGQSRQ